MNSVNSQRCGAQPDQPEIIDERVSATEFNITVPGCVVSLVKFASSEQAHGQQCDIHTHMRRSARVLQGLVDGVCEGQRLAVQLPNLKCCLVLDDGLVDLGAFGACAGQGQIAQEAQDVWHIHRHNPCVCGVVACGAQPVRNL